MANNFYREETVTIKAGQLKEIAYGFGENPNHFYVNNLSAATLYCGITNLPSPEAAEMKVDGNTAKIVARRDGSVRFYIFNASNTNDATVLLTSFSEAFNPVILALMNQSLSVDMQGVTIEGGGTIEEINCPLPPGANTIGAVNVNTGQNHIGSVGVDTVPAVVEQGAQALKNHLETMRNNTGYTSDKLTNTNSYLATIAATWTDAKITQVLSAINNIAAVAGGEEFTGTIAQQAGAPGGNPGITLDFSANNQYINKVFHLRCKKGVLAVYFNPTDTSQASDRIIMNEGDTINDVSGMIEKIQIIGGDSNAEYEILYSVVTLS